MNKEFKTIEEATKTDELYTLRKVQGLSRQNYFDMVTSTKEVERNEEYKTLERIARYLENGEEEVVTYEISPNFLKLYNLGFTVFKDNLAYKYRNVKFDVNTYNGIGLKVMRYTYLEADQVHSAFVIKKHDEEDFLNLIKIIESDRETLREGFDNKELKLLEVLKKGTFVKEIKPIDKLHPAYFIYRKIEEEGETAENQVLLRIARGEKTPTAIAKRYEQLLTETIKEGKEAEEIRREKIEEAKKEIAKDKNYFLKNFLKEESKTESKIMKRVNK